MLPDSLLPLCEKLETVLERMEKVVARLNTVVEMSRGVAALEKFNKPESSSIILFQTWDVGRFAEVFTEISDKYSQEMKLKHNVAENICHATDRNTVMFYSACWLHQVYVNNGDDILLESVLLETCHKT
ncbi:hypothetical protein DPMN_093794 [Dreissena polymorpha]|uniref:Uncharacterized protein n=2 Tax=Dreissena polymorpha TaxID=45954 RepID=A0A9D4L4U8_DREPO|nr:hypothetical protein DPMN_093794 [Dreissena polymorpha]